MRGIEHAKAHQPGVTWLQIYLSPDRLQPGPSECADRRERVGQIELDLVFQVAKLDGSPTRQPSVFSKTGGANSLLHDGAAATPQIEACLTFATEWGTNDYYVRLFHAAQDTLIFADERCRFVDRT